MILALRIGEIGKFWHPSPRWRLLDRIVYICVVYLGGKELSKKRFSVRLMLWTRILSMMLLMFSVRWPKKAHRCWLLALSRWKGVGSPVNGQDNSANPRKPSFTSFVSCISFHLLFHLKKKKRKKKERHLSWFSLSDRVSIFLYGISEYLSLVIFFLLRPFELIVW